jgi:DNA-binding transcriptional LysR family regulator
MDRLRTIEIFTTVVEAQSYTAAARQLGLSRSHLSKQISELEDELGVRLLNRTTRRVGATEPGQVYYDTCVRILGELAEAEVNLGKLQHEPRGTVRILAPKSLAVLELADVLGRFGHSHPQLKVEVFLEDQLLDLVEHGFDLALRFGEQAESALIARRLCAVRFLVCATPGYLRKHGVPRHPTDLAQHECLRHVAVSRDARWHFRRKEAKADAKGGSRADEGEIAVEVHGRLAANSTVFLRECVLRGEGIGLLPSFSVRREIKNRRLRPILTNYETMQLPLYAVFPHSRHLATKVRLCIDFLADWFGHHFDR